MTITNSTQIQLAGEITGFIPAPRDIGKLIGGLIDRGVKHVTLRP